MHRLPTGANITDEQVQALRDASKCTGPFDVDTLDSKDPIEQFRVWYDEAAKAACDIFDPNAMSVATATKDGIPSCRMILLRGFDSQGFRFYGCYGSRKALEIKENPHTSLQFYWEPCGRSVRIEGKVEKLTESECDVYFNIREKSAQISAHVSHQSDVIEGRQSLHDKYNKIAAEFADTVVPRPAQWGGYRLKPEVMEFWQVQEHRLHDRLRFRKLNDGEQADHKLTHPAIDGWVIERLCP